MSSILDNVSSVFDGAKEVLGVKDLFSAYKQLNEIELAKSFQKSQNYINELNATAAIGRLQNQVLTGEAQAAAMDSNTKKYLGYGAVAVVGLVAVYFLTKR